MLSRTVEPDVGSPGAVGVARTAGALYLPAFILGPFSLMFVRANLIVPGDTAATAGRLATHGSLLHLGSVAELYLALTDVVLAAAFYVLLRPVHATLALVAAFLRLTWGMVAVVAMLTNFAAARAANRPDPSPALARLFLDLHDYAAAAGFVAFGAHLAVLGYLIARSDIIPRTIGILLIIAGVGYVGNSLLTLGWDVPSQPVLLLPAFPAELALSLWLLIKGVRGDGGQKPEGGRVGM